MAKKKRRSGLRRQVDLEAKIRYGPQKRALRELLDEAFETLKTTVATEEGAAQGVRAAVNAAKPQVKKIYADAHGSQDQAESDVRRDLSMLSSAADPYKAVSAREAGGAKRRLAESLAGASKELVEREGQAESGRAYAVSNAVRTYNTDRSKIGRERSGLAEDIGNFKSATYGSLKKAAADEKAAQRKENRDYRLRVDALSLDVEAEARQQRKTDSEITGIDPATGKPTAGERERRRKARDKKDPKSKFRAGALAKHQKILEGVQDANATVKRLRRQGVSFPEIGTVLTSPKGQKNPYGGYGPMTARAAVELARDKRLSGGTYRTLKSRGLLGHRAPKGWKPRKRAKALW